MFKCFHFQMKRCSFFLEGADLHLNDAILKLEFKAVDISSTKANGQGAGEGANLEGIWTNRKLAQD